jgi:hypothetical protein
VLLSYSPLIFAINLRAREIATSDVIDTVEVECCVLIELVIDQISNVLSYAEGRLFPATALLEDQGVNSARFASVLECAITEALTEQSQHQPEVHSRIVVRFLICDINVTFDYLFSPNAFF